MSVQNADSFLEFMKKVSAKSPETLKARVDELTAVVITLLDIVTISLPVLREGAVTFLVLARLQKSLAEDIEFDVSALMLQKRALEVRKLFPEEAAIADKK